MCGIYGAVALGDAPLRHPECLPRMGALLRHRGPHGCVLWTDDRDGHRPRVALGACRLRIRDPRSAADQPFTDPRGQIVVACNGEIYNAPSLRAWYPAYAFRSRSDVEPLVPLLRDRGPAAMDELDGMFALASWDARVRRLLLARDPAGEKPLFYARLGAEVWFASEIQALLAHPELSWDLDPDAVDQILVLGYALEPRTAFAGVRRVPAGSALLVDPGGEECRRYWDPCTLVRTAPGDDPAGRLGQLIRDAVARQVVADVPVGVLASGGLDSALLAALAAGAVRPERLTLFTAGFAERSYDESGVAARLARHLGCRHVVETMDTSRVVSTLDAVVEGTAEPITDPAVLPTFLLARRAVQDVGVVLSGEGADELFGGYPTYIGHGLAEWFTPLPAVVRRSVRGIARRLPASRRKVPLTFLLERFASHAGRPWLERHVQWFGTGLPDPSRLARVLPALAAELCPGVDGDAVGAAMRLDYRTYLRDGLLVKLDRATMLVSLEARAPYLDRRVTRFALGLEARESVAGLRTKRPLAAVAAAWIPPFVLRRRKRGLSVPLAAWLGGPLRPAVDRLLDPDRLRRREGVPFAQLVRHLVAEQRAGRADHGRALWPLLVYERWREHWIGG